LRIDTLQFFKKNFIARLVINGVNIDILDNTLFIYNENCPFRMTF